MGAFVTALMLGLLALPVAAQESPRELHQKAFAKLAQGEYADAIPDLEQLITLLGESTTASIVASMEMVYYNVGLCYFLVGQFEAAEKGFQTYLKKYKNGAKSSQATLFIADSLRFRNKLKEAVPAYREAMRKYRYSKGEKAEIYSSIARCYLAEDKWHEAIDPLSRVYAMAYDFTLRNWAATLLTTAYFKELKIEKVYPLVPYLLRPNSFAARSVAFNLSALQAGDELFADERYRDALWVHRMVYPYDLVMVRSQEYKDWLGRQAEIARKTPGYDLRRLMHLQESIAEVEEEIKVLESSENYDLQLYSRIARGYMEELRYWEAREIFLHLHGVAPKELGEESLYLAFMCSIQVLPWDRAYEIGGMYMDQYPAGEYFDPLTLTMGQLYAKQEDWPNVIRHLTKTLQVSPNHTSGAECMFLIGYASFMEGQFEQCIEWLTQMNTRYPQSELVPASTYWIAMSWLFQLDYEKAGKEFDHVLQDYPDSLYAEDASFRTAVCRYGLSDFEAAEERLKTFMAGYPESKLFAEATMTLADVEGTLGKLPEAIQLYARAMEYPEDQLNTEFYNHCAFQAGRILNDNADFAGMRAHFERYIARKRPGSNIPQAVYWIGIALWNSGEQDGAMRYYREAVVEYGRDPNAIGIDMILDEWVGRTKRSTAEQAAQAWNDLRSALVRAKTEKNKTLELRLKRVLVYDPEVKPTEKQELLNEFTSTNSLAFASAATLQAMLDLAMEKKRLDFAERAADKIIETYTETDYALDARMFLAGQYIARAAATADEKQKEKLYQDAIKHLEVVREVFAATGEAGQAQILLGKLYFDRNDYARADKCYENVLGVKDWRPLWPEALYGRGECAYAQRMYDVAAAYYERIYIMYGQYAKWAAKSYLRRAESLVKAYQNEKARQVIQEMLTLTEIANEPETASARELLKRIGGG